MSGIEPHLLEIAFNTFKENSICQDALFVMNIQPVTILCKQCHKESELEKFHYICPHCQSHELEVIDGEEMLLMSLEMETDS
jgi:hydrogenase nickel insertion protein HypA